MSSFIEGRKHGGRGQAVFSPVVAAAGSQDQRAPSVPEPYGKGGQRGIIRGLICYG